MTTIADAPEHTALTDLLRDPERVAKLPSEAIPPILCQLSALQNALTARLLTAPVSTNGNKSPEGDILVDVKEAARRLGMSKDWVYRNEEKLPFFVRQGRRVKFSSKGIDDYIRKRQRR